MIASHSDRNLLFGVLALQMDFLGRDPLLRAMTAWASEKHRPIGEILVEHGAIDADDRAALEAIVDRHLSRHDGDAQKSLASIDTPWTARDLLDEAGSLGPDGQETVAQTESTRLSAPGDGSQAARHPGPDTRGGRFRILRLHDRGGLGEVFLARDEEVRREVAVKQIRAEQADIPQRRARFLREAEITGGLEHPGIVPVYGLGTHRDGRPFYAMRFIKGDTLKAAIARFHGDESLQKDPGARSLELRKLLEPFLVVCDAIAYAHSRGVIHRDLKPGNIMLGPFGETLVVDWGLAKPTGRPGEDADDDSIVPETGRDVDATEDGERMGTPAYMAPEQAAGRTAEVGPRSDVYSLGATLYVILAGRPAFPERDLPTVLRRVDRGEFPPPRKVRPWVDGGLEAICLKAMRLRAEDRYATPAALAEDVRKWLADEPVSAWTEPVARRVARWANRRRTLVTSSAVAVAVGLCALGYGLYEARLRSSQRLTEAVGRVDALTTAEVRALPLIIEQVAPDLALVHDRLIAMARPDGSERDGHRRLAASLALLPVDPSRGEYLASRARAPDTPPEEVLVIRDAMARDPGRLEFAAGFRREVAGVAGEVSDSQLRAAGALAALVPGDPLWAGLAAPLAGKLAGENSLKIPGWREVFQPVSRALTAPLLSIFADATRPERRDRAFTLLFEFAVRPDNARRPEDLAALLVDADPERMDLLLGRLVARADRDRAVAALAPRMSPVARFDDGLAERQGRVGSALMRLGHCAPIWPLLAATDDPGTRAELVHEIGRRGNDPAEVVARLRAAADPGSRRALILCLGGFPEAAFRDADRDAVAATMRDLYRDDPDPGVHGAIAWLFRRAWSRGDQLDPIDRSARARDPIRGRDWYVNGEGQSFAVVRGPVTSRMGATRAVDPEGSLTEAPHDRIIDRSFAIGMREVTVEEYERFAKAHPGLALDGRALPDVNADLPTADCAAGYVTWYEAARYCNWLSEREGLPPERWCYPEVIAPGLVMPEAYWLRTGYRLPTEAEWEFACRAGTASSRPYGRSPSRLAEYGWYERNAGRKMHPVGSLRPNDLGLFDVLGNAYEWTGDAFEPYPTPRPTNPPRDEPIVPASAVDVDRVARGGSFVLSTQTLRSAFRSSGIPPRVRYSYFGFRLARTCP